MHLTTSLSLEAKKFRIKDLPNAPDLYIAKLLISKVLSGELPAVLIPPIFGGNQKRQHRNLGKLAMQVLREANPDLTVNEYPVVIAHHVSERGELGMHIDGSTELNRGLRLHTNIKRGSKDSFAAAADNYAMNILPLYKNAPPHIVRQAEELYRQGYVNPTMISDEVYIGDQPQDYSVVVGINGAKNVWHRFETIKENGVGPRLITVSDVSYS